MMPPQPSGGIPPALQAAMPRPPAQVAPPGGVGMGQQLMQLVSGAKTLLAALAAMPQVDQSKLQAGQQKLFEGVNMIAEAVKGGQQPGMTPPS